MNKNHYYYDKTYKFYFKVLSFFEMEKGTKAFFVLTNKNTDPFKVDCFNMCKMSGQCESGKNHTCLALIYFKFARREKKIIKTSELKGNLLFA